MTKKVTVIFPGFQGFPGAVGTLHAYFCACGGKDALHCSQ